MEHLSLEIFDLKGTGSKYAALPDNASITITDTSEIFGSGDVWSYSFQLNVNANASIFGTSGEIHGSRLHEQINKRRARLWVEGIPLYLGYLKLDDEVDVDGDGNVDVTFESGQKTFDQKIEGGKANQVPMMSDVPIGVALWRNRTPYHSLQMKVLGQTVKGKSSDNRDKWYHGMRLDSWIHDKWGRTDIPIFLDGNLTPLQQWPRMVYPKGVFDTEQAQPYTFDFLNTDLPYTEDDNGTPTNPYCNVALCYQKYGYKKKDDFGNETDDYSSEPEAEREYETMPANRVNSAPNFFVIYWLRCLMHYLGIHIDENQMLDIEDLRRLFLVNSKCAYKKVEWKQTDVAWYRQRPGHNVLHASYDKGLFFPEECGLEITDWQAEGPFSNFQQDIKPGDWELEKFKVEVVKSVASGDDNMRGWFHDAVASSDCFPNVDISEVISALQSGFGIRLLFSDNYQRVRIVLLRNVFRSSDIQTMACEVVSSEKSENNIRGFRLTYGNTEDTHFYYKGFADKLPHMKELWPDTSDEHDYSKWKLDAEYSELFNKVTAFNKTCYVTPLTGNAYGIKVDEQAKRYDDLHQSLFEFATFMDAEDGDCTGEENTIETINVGFTPAIMNDLNYKDEKDGNTTEQRFALFVDEKMRPRRPDLDDKVDYNDADAVYYVAKDSAPEGRKALYDDDSPAAKMKKDGIVKPGEFAIASDAEYVMPVEAGLNAKITFSNGYHTTYIPGRVTYNSPSTVTEEVLIWYNIKFGLKGHINEGYRLYLQDNYEPNDDGISPIESHDWGLTLGIMRGSGSDAHIDYSGDPDDEEGNDTWDLIPGSKATIHPDICDCYGREWVYDNTVVVVTPQQAKERIAEMWPDSHYDLLNRDDGDEWNVFYLMPVRMARGGYVKVLVKMPPSVPFIIKYQAALRGMTREEILSYDATHANIIVEMDSSSERNITLSRLRAVAFDNGSPVTISGGTDVRAGRISLKLRAEKPNPYFDSTQPESDTNRRYLEITNENLRGRGLADKFYKEYSYWVRNARICKMTVRMTIAQLQGIDKTKRVKIDDMTGFIKKMQYSVSNETGLGLVTLEVMYI